MKSLISFVAFVITAAEFTYWLGRRSRQAVDCANDTLAALWAVSWGVGEEQHYELVSEAIDVLIAVFAPKPSLTPLAEWTDSDGIGSIWTVGIGKGTGTGKPCHWLFVDDTIKGREEAKAVITASTLNPVAEPTSAKLCNPRPARRRRATKKNQD